MVAILFLFGYFFLCYLWYKLGRFLIMLFTNDFNWKDFKQDWAQEDEGVDELIYVCWLIIVPIFKFQIIERKIKKKL